jgi:hypothetical protein
LGEERFLGMVLCDPFWRMQKIGSQPRNSKDCGIRAARRPRTGETAAPKNNGRSGR